VEGCDDEPAPELQSLEPQSEQEPEPEMHQAGSEPTTALPQLPVEITFFSPSDCGPCYPTSLYDIHPAVRDVFVKSFVTIGRFVGLCIWKRQPLPIRFAPAFLTQILGKKPRLEDYDTVNPWRNRNQLQYILHNGIWSHTNQNFGSTSVDSVEEVIDVLEMSGNFTVETDFETIELKPGGRAEMITDQNKHEFVELLTNYLLVICIERQLAAFCSGLSEYVPVDCLHRWFSAMDLTVLISGPETVNVADWKGHTRYRGQLKSSANQCIWFWEHIESVGDVERLKILRFITGKGAVPAGGFKSFEPRCTISEASSVDASYLPVAHTCNHEIELPAYPTKEIFVQKLQVAVDNTLCFDIA
jgi:E3 ubiquitin-protein ligase NEDD4